MRRTELIFRKAPVLLAVGALLVGCGSGGEGEAADPFRIVEPTSVVNPEDLRRAAPRWEALAKLSGTGKGVRRLEIPGRSIQWRVRWRCKTGKTFTLKTAPAATDSPSLVRGRCPGRGVALAARGGRFDLSVEAQGKWTAEVEQQVDAPLREPPLPQMRAAGARVLKRAQIRPVERRGEGTVELYQLPGGRLALRFERFNTTASSDLEVWVSRARRPSTSKAAARSRPVSKSPLKSTSGSQNYLLPRDIKRADVRSIVLWCEPLYVAYASAGLKPVKRSGER